MFVYFQYSLDQVEMLYDRDAPIRVFCLRVWVIWFWTNSDTESWSDISLKNNDKQQIVFGMSLIFYHVFLFIYWTLKQSTFVIYFHCFLSVKKRQLTLWRQENIHLIQNNY